MFAYIKYYFYYYLNILLYYLSIPLDWISSFFATFGWYIVFLLIIYYNFSKKIHSFYDNIKCKLTYNKEFEEYKKRVLDEDKKRVRNLQYLRYLQKQSDKLSENESENELQNESKKES